MQVVEKAHAKINLVLDVLGKRNDNYHEVKMIMQTLELADRLEINPADCLSVLTTGADLPSGEENIAFRAARLMGEYAGIEPAVQIKIEKQIPLAAGLAGGSADAAAVLRGLDRLWQLAWPLDKLQAIAGELGSDVPFCLCGGTALASGRGEMVTPLQDCPETMIVLACPQIEVSTAWVYQNFSTEMVVLPSRLPAALKGLENGDLQSVTDSLSNVLEFVTIEQHPVIGQIKSAMLQAGAQSSLMSGSGPAVFGFVKNHQVAELVAKAVSTETGARVWITRTRRPLWKI